MYVLVVTLTAIVALFGPACLRRNVTFESVTVTATCMSVVLGVVGFAGSRLGILLIIRLLVLPMFIFGICQFRFKRIPGVVYVVTGWTVGVSALPAVFTIGGWRYDWFEHFERATWFWSGPSPLTTTFQGGYTFLARPPLTNSLAGLLMWSPDFGSYQMVMGVIGALLPINIVWVAGLLRPAANNTVQTTVLVMASPLIVTPLLFPWTKSHSAALCVCAVGATIRYRETSSTQWLTVAFLMWGAGTLSHYSAIPFGFAGCITLLVSARKRGPVNLFVAGLISMICCGWWPIWAFAHYGSAVLTSTSATTQRELPFVTRFAGNIASTFGWTTPTKLGSIGMSRLADIVWGVFTGRFWFAAGLTCGIVAVWVVRTSHRPTIFLAAVAVLIGVATVPFPGWDGTAHVIAIPVLAVMLAVAVSAPNRVFVVGQWVSHVLVLGVCGWVLSHPNPTESRYVADTIHTMSTTVTIAVPSTVGRTVLWGVVVFTPIVLALYASRQGAARISARTAPQLNDVKQSAE